MNLISPTLTHPKVKNNYLFQDITNEDFGEEPKKLSAQH